MAQVSAVDDEPILLGVDYTGPPACTPHSSLPCDESEQHPSTKPMLAHTIRVAPLRLDTSLETAFFPTAAYLEITISGWGTGADCDAAPGGVCVYTARFLVTPFITKAQPQERLSVETLVASASVSVVHVVTSSADGGPGMLVELVHAAEREVVVDVRRVGRPLSQPLVTLVH